MDRVNAYIGRLVVIDTGTNSYEGTVKYIDTKQKKIILKKVKDCSTGELMRTDKHFLGNEIKDLQVKEDVACTRNKQQEKYDKNEEEQRNSNSADHKSLQKLNVTLDSSDSGRSLLQMEHLDPCQYLAGEMPRLCNSYLHDPPQALLVNSIGQTFNEAIIDISSQKVVSLVVEGTKINRYSKISLIIIGTRQMVYLFDVTSMGRNCFTEGMADILTNQNLLKVTHDVRDVSDCLSGVYGIHPVNVFDTQVADLYIQKQLEGSFPKEVSTLTRCVEKYLNIHSHDCMFENEKRRITKEKQYNWFELTQDQAFLKACAKEAMYLRELRTVMIKQMLAEYLHCVDIYLNCVRNLPDQSVTLYNPAKVPRDLENIDLHKKVGRRKRMKNDVYYDSTSDESMERRSAWDTGQNFSEKYEEIHGTMIEYASNKLSVIDLNKPLLKTTNQADQINPDLRETPVSNSFTYLQPSTSLQGKDIPNIFEELSRDKRLNGDKTFVVDEYRMSASDSDDSSFFLSSVDDKPLSGVPIKTDKKPIERPKISSVGKKLIINNIRQYERDNNVTSNDTSSVSGDEYPYFHQANSLDKNVNISFHGAAISPPPGLERKSSTENRKQVKTLISAGRGRGRLLKMLAEKDQPQANNLTIGGRTEYDFPSDNELLVSPPVAEMVANVPFSCGKTVTVVKK